MDIKTFSNKNQGELLISPNFKVKEFRCKDGSDEITLDVSFIREKLQNIRNRFGAPVVINSAFRTITYNKRVGGATNSYHTKGRAFDIVVKGVPLDDVCKYAQSIGVKGIIRYNTFVHIDSRESVYFARNNNGMVSKVTSFL